MELVIGRDGAVHKGPEVGRGRESLGIAQAGQRRCLDHRGRIGQRCHRGRSCRRLCNGRCLRFDSSMDAGALTRLIRAVEAA